MTLLAEDVIDLQYFLLDAAKRSAVGAAGADGDLLASAAALDYVLLLSSETEADASAIDAESPIACGVRDTLARAANAALDFVATVVPARADVRRDFISRQTGRGGIFGVLRRMSERDVIRDDDVAFRRLTIASELFTDPTS